MKALLIVGALMGAAGYLWMNKADDLKQKLQVIIENVSSVSVKGLTATVWVDVSFKNYESLAVPVEGLTAQFFKQSGDSWDLLALSEPLPPFTIREVGTTTKKIGITFPAASIGTALFSSVTGNFKTVVLYRAFGKSEREEKISKGLLNAG